MGWLFVGRLHREILVSWCVRSSMYGIFHIVLPIIPINFMLVCEMIGYKR